MIAVFAVIAPEFPELELELLGAAKLRASLDQIRAQIADADLEVASCCQDHWTVKRSSSD